MKRGDRLTVNFNGKDISTAFQGVQAGKIVRVDPEIVAMLVQPLSNGGAIRELRCIREQLPPDFLYGPCLLHRVVDEKSERRKFRDGRFLSR